MRTHFLIFNIVFLSLLPSLSLADDEDSPRPVETADTIRLSPQAEKDKVMVEATTIKRLRTEARTHYRQGAYKLAIRQFQSAYRLSNDYEILYELALTHHVLRNWEECGAYMDRYLREAPRGPKRDRALNTKQSCKARQEISQALFIESDPPGADIYFDNRNTPIQGQTPFRTQVGIGVKRIWLELKGYEPEIKDIELRRGEPMRLRVILRKRVEKGWLYIDSNIRNAQVYVDGKPLQLTPLLKPVPVSAGEHQVQVRREGFGPFERNVRIKRFLMTRVDAPLGRANHVSTWRSSLGWSTIILGGLALAGGAVATYYADQQYNDSPQFDELVGYERLGYVGGVALLTTGGSLLIWDSLRYHFDPSERNTRYGQPMDIPDPDKLWAPQESGRGGR